MRRRGLRDRVSGDGIRAADVRHAAGERERRPGPLSVLWPDADPAEERLGRAPARPARHRRARAPHRAQRTRRRHPFARRGALRHQRHRREPPGRSRRPVGVRAAGVHPRTIPGGDPTARLRRARRAPGVHQARLRARRPTPSRADTVPSSGPSGCGSARWRTTRRISTTPSPASAAISGSWR